MTGATIEADRLGKRYRIGASQARYTNLTETISGALRGGPDQRARDIWALRDVTFRAGAGEVVGVVGRNGSGKSTLLKLLARITLPTEGQARTRGRVGALLEVGTGFHAELTGRENVYLNGAIMGMSRRDVARRFDEIVAFAGVERFLDTPLKRYSTGMELRLAFAVAAHLDPDIMLVDEVLAVGDREFRRRCLGAMSRLGREGRTVLFVSHDLGAVTELCERTLWLEGGELRGDGPTRDVLDDYARLDAGEPAGLAAAGEAPGAVQFRSVDLLDVQGRTPTAPQRDQPLKVVLRVGVREPVLGLDAAIRLLNTERVCVIDARWSDAAADDEDIGTPGEYALTVELPSILPAGTYRIEVWLGTVFETLFHDEVLTFRLMPRPEDPRESIERRRMVQPPLAWRVSRSAPRSLVP